MKHSEIKATNPLYQALKNPPYFVPDYTRLAPHHFDEALKVAISDARRALGQIKKRTAPADFDNTVLAFDRACETVTYISRAFSQLILLRRVPELEIFEKGIKKRETTFWNDIYGDAALFKRIAQVKRATKKEPLPHEDQLLTEKIYKDFYEHGATLKATDRAAVAEIDKKMADLHAAYNQGMKEYIQNSFRVITDPEMLKGIPQERLDTAKKEAEKRDIQGAWVFTGDTDTWLDVVLNAQSRELRKIMYKPDETGILGDFLTEMLRLRQDRAALFGFNSHYRYKNRDKPYANERDLKRLLDVFREQIRPIERLEKKELAAFAHDEGLPRMERCDAYYYEERLKKLKLGFNDASLRPYLNIVRVKETVFEVLGNLFEVDFVRRTDIPSWHEDVETYEVRDRGTGEASGLVTLDLFARPQKNEGAWCEALSSHGTFQKQTALPFVNVTCNMRRAANKDESGVTLYDVATLFHEFGHGMHCLKGKTKHMALSGFNNVGLDFVEFPSQVLENFTYEPWVIDHYARHEKTGDYLPPEMKENIRHMRQFQGAGAIRFALEITYLDMILHSRNMKKADLTTIEVEKLAELFPGRSKQYVIAPIFEHIATYGYDAAYHAYFSTEIQEAAAFDALNPHKNDFPQKIAALRDVFAAASLKTPEELLEPLIGGQIDISPTFERYGLVGPRPAFFEIQDILSETVPQRLLDTPAANIDILPEHMRLEN